MVRTSRSLRLVDDIHGSRHLEAYALFLTGMALVVLGLVGVVGESVTLSAILLALSFLVFHTTVRDGSRKTSLNQILGGRADLGAFNQRLPGIHDLRIYGPTAANLLDHAGDIRRFVLHPGGHVRVMVISDSRPARTLAAIQLDDTLDLDHNLRRSLTILRKLAHEPGFRYRRLPVNPGYGLVIVNADDPDGYVIFESHGFKDDNVADRMHVVIKREDSPRWFTYWVERYEAMWRTAKPPAGESTGTADSGHTTISTRVTA